MASRALTRPLSLRLISTRSRPFSTVVDAPVDPKTQRIAPAAGQKSVFEDAAQAVSPRMNWTREEIAEVYNQSLIELTYASVVEPVT